LSSDRIILIILLAIALESYVLLGGLRLAYSQEFLIPSKRNLSLPGFAATFPIAISRDDNLVLAGKKLSLDSTKLKAHYPTLQEKDRIDRILNQTLSILPPLSRAINESHSCILEAVICGSGNMTNATVLKL
jgi:hypothetical protein